jgi:hypothetical protein
MTPKQKELATAMKAARDARMKQLHAEDQMAKRDLKDPEFTVDDLMQISGKSRGYICKLLMEAKIGGVVSRPHRDGGIKRVRVVRWSQLESLVGEMGWL